MRLAALFLAFALAGCASTTPEALATMQAEVAREMGITFYLPPPVLVDTVEMHADGRTQARTLCWVQAKVVLEIQYARHIDWSRNKAIIAHELHHAIQCHEGRPLDEQEAQAVERWWTAKH